MVIRGLKAFRTGRCHWQYIAVVALCALFQVAAADEQRDNQSQDATPETDVTEKSMPEIRIKRLKLADPESTEVMLAGRGLNHSERRLSCSIT